MLLYYSLGILLGTLAAAFIYMICCDLTLLVAGEEFKYFCGDFFIRGMLVSLPLVASLVLGLLVLYGIRHRNHPVLSIISYCVLGAFTWLVLIPCSFSLTKKYENSGRKRYEVPFLSSGYFRPEAGGVFYFSRVYDDGTADGIFIDLTGITGEKGSVVKYQKSIIDADFSVPFADSLIRDSIKLPFIIVAPLSVYSIMMERGMTAWNNGYISWLVFVSFALALLSCICLKNISNWRLINGLAVLFGALVVCFFNAAYYKGYIFSRAASTFAAYLAGLVEGKAGIIHSFLTAPDPLLALLNVISFVLLIVTGVVCWIMYSRNEEEV